MFDPRTLGAQAYDALAQLRTRSSADRLKEQKGQAVELFTYLATWGLMRLRAEESALSQDGKKDVVRAFFTALASLSGRADLSLEQLRQLPASDYLGLTGLALALAREFAFWANALYHDVKGAD